MIARLLVLLVLTSFLPAAVGQEKLDADRLLGAVVQVRAKSLANARSNATLGAQREGSGVLVREGYVATIGYLVIEAEAIEVTNMEGKSVPATLAGYDHATGFGVLRLLAPLAGVPMPLGESSALAERDRLLFAGYGSDAVRLVYLASRRPFSGSWEYLLDAALYTYPAAPNWSGAALINAKGELMGLGSLIVGDAPGAGVQAPGNMFVPVDLLKPILGDLIDKGKPAGPVRPWLGMNTEEVRGRLVVTRVSPDGPADRAGVKSGDLLVAVGADEVSTLAELYRKVWARGAAGVEVPLKLLQGTQVKEITVRSIDRTEYFRAKPAY
jgi:serine protease Do